MSAMKDIWTDITTTMWNVSESLNDAADGGEAEVIETVLTESIAHLARVLNEFNRAK